MTGSTPVLAETHGEAANERQLCRALRDGDEEAFALILGRYHAPLMRLALCYVRNRGVAEEVVQETWLGVIKGIEHFEGRSSLKTWIFSILKYTAMSRARREGHSLPFSSLVDPYEPAVEPERFLGANDPRWQGHWSSPPASWDAVPEDRLVSTETRDHIAAAIRELPPLQQSVITLADIEGCAPSDVCELLEVSETYRRVLLHRARSQVRRHLESYLLDA